MPHNILDIFTRVVGLPAAERAARLRALCEGDAQVEATVRQMLQADLDDSPLLDAPGAVELALAVDLARATPPADEVVPTRVGPYTIRRILGSGGMGVVYEAEESHPRRLVALKVLHDDLQTRGNLERFRLEVQTVADLRHPCIPQVLAAGEVDGSPWLAMELVDGVPIHHAAAGRDLDDRIRLLATVADTIEAVHRRGVLHCDLKPANLLVGADATPHVLDFGLASTTRRPRDRGGTPAYMAPEQRDGGPLDARVDVFALGRLGLEVCAVGRAAPLPVDVRAVLDKAAAPERDRRYGSMAALAADLRNLVARRPVSARRSTIGYRGERFFARHRGLLRGFAVAAGGVLLVGLGAALLSAQLERRAAMGRERAAALRLEVLRGRIDALTDRSDQAGALVDAFVRLPENQGTAAISRAWAWWADRLDARGERESAADARGRAYVDATDAALQREALVTIARSFIDEARWSELDAVLGHLGPWRGDPEIEALRRQADAGSRRLGHLGGVVGRWAEGIRLPLRGYRVDVAPWRDGSLVVFQQQPQNIVVELGGAPAFPVLRTWPIPDEVAHGFSFPRAVRGLDATWVGRTHDGATLIAGPSGPARVTEGPSVVLLASAVTGAGDLLLGTGLPDRALLRVRPDAGGLRVDRPSAAVDVAASDVNALLAYDLDGDGTDEVVIAQGPWNVYDVQVLRADADGLVPDAALQLGFVAAAAVLQTARGPRILALKFDSYPNRIVLGAERPTGSPAGLYVLRWQPGSLEVEQFVPVPHDGGRLHQAAVGDLDGDGHEDVVISVGVEGEDAVWPLLGGPRGLEPLQSVGGLALLGLTDVDGDGRAELLARVPDDDHHTWVLGVPGRPLPAQPARPFEPSSQAAGPRDPAVLRVWERVRALASMGLYLPAARALRSAEALNPVRDDGPLLTLQIAEWALAGEAVGEAREVLATLDPASTVDPEHRRRAARAALAMGDLKTAARWLPDTAARLAVARELGWSALPEVPAAFDLIRAPVWSVHDPQGMVWAAGDVRLDLFADGVVTAESALDWPGGALALEVALDLADIELGGEARFSLSPAEAPDLALTVVVRHAGGGLDTQLIAGCDARPTGVFGHRSPLGRSARVGRAMTVRLLWNDATERVTCAVNVDGREVFHDETAIDWAPAAGGWRLVVQGAADEGSPSYARARLSVAGLVVEGAAPLPPRPVGASAVPVTRQLRRQPSLPATTPEALAAYAGAWGSAIDSLDAADLAQGMSPPELDALPGATFDERLLLLGRAVYLAQRGDLEAAARALDTMLAESARVGDERWFLVRRARALRVAVARRMGDAAAEARVRAAFATGHPDPARASEQLDRLIEALAPASEVRR